MIAGRPYQFYVKEGYGYGKGWINYSTGERAYCEGNGKLKTGYTKIDGKYYYFDKDGYMQGGTAYQWHFGDPISRACGNRPPGLGDQTYSCGIRPVAQFTRCRAFAQG